MEADDVAEKVEVIDIMQPAVHRRNPFLRLTPVAAVHRRNPFLRLTPVAPELQAVDLAGPIRPARIPGEGFPSMGPDIGDHLLDEPGIRESDLVRADMDIRPAEHVEDLVQQLPQDGFPLRGLHPEAHRALERAAVARHVEFRNQRHAPVAAEGIQLTHLVLRVEHPGLAEHVLRRIELRIPLAFQPPGLVLGQMEMEHIDLELREDVHLPLELFQADVRAPHVHHPPAHAETGPVHDAAARNPALFRQLLERLPGVPDALLRDGLDMDARLVDGQAVRLVLVQDGLRRRYASFSFRTASGMDSTNVSVSGAPARMLPPVNSTCFGSGNSAGSCAFAQETSSAAAKSVFANPPAIYCCRLSSVVTRPGRRAWGCGRRA